MILKILLNPDKAENQTLIYSLGEEYKSLFDSGRLIVEDYLLYY